MPAEPPAAFRPQLPTPQKDFDPLRLCVFTTIALIAWVITPPATVMVMSALGVRAYAAARRRGLLRSRCVLGDTRVVIGYLASAFILGAVFTLREVIAALP